MLYLKRDVPKREKFSSDYGILLRRCVKNLVVKNYFDFIAVDVVDNNFDDLNQIH